MPLKWFPHPPVCASSIGPSLASCGRSLPSKEPVAYDWTGPYIGIQGGYAWGENDASAEQLPDPGIVALDSEDVTVNGDDGSIAIDGWVGGLHAGYLWQHDSLVFGIEGDGEFADIDGDTDGVLEGDPEPIGSIEQEIDWLASLRLRAGFAMDRTLIYATGGLAVGGVELSLVDEDGDEFASEKDTEWGWTIGGGLEHAFTDALTARIEYRYTDLGDIRVEANDEEEITAEADTAFHAVRLGLSWQFDN